MPPPDRDLVERVKGAVDIADVAEQYFPLTRKGERFLALCPFHREKTPSFSVHSGKQIFHCFGCGKGGDVLTLVMELDRLSFPEALRQLAERAGIALPERGGGGGRVGAGDQRRLRQLELLERAATFYREQLDGSEGERARAYLRQRGFDRETIDTFRIGFAPDAWRALHASLDSSGFDEEEQLHSGLVRNNDKGNVWDLLRNRIVIPIRDPQGRVIAFGGRVLAGSFGDAAPAATDVKAPKYVNSPETELFSKRSVLFNFDRARREATARGAFVVVEGYMDVLAAHRRGVPNVVASLGTAFTREHVTQMRRYANRVVLLFDADEGGARASDRGVTLLLEEGLDVTVATLPAGLDPDDFFREHDAGQFEAFLNDSQEDLFGFLIRRARERIGIGADGEREAGSVSASARAAREVLGLVERTRDPILRDLFVRRISQEFGVDEAVLRKTSRSGQAEAGDRGGSPPGGAGSGPAAGGRRGAGKAWEQDEASVLQGAVTDAEVAKLVVTTLSGTDFRDSGRRAVFAAIRDQVGEGGAPAPSLILELLAGDESARVAFQYALGQDPLPGDGPQQAVERIVGRRDQLEYRRLREEASRSGILMSGDSEDLDRHLAEFTRFHAGRIARSTEDGGEETSGRTH